MGMAAGQARLLSITSRMSDNELRAQIINNNKMRLATESSQVSEAYVTALNEAQLMFTSYDADKNSTYKPLTFKALTAYSPYNNQYGLVNSVGNILVSETDASNFKNSTSVADFLLKYGLEETTTYFDNLVKNLTDDGIPYKGDYDYEKGNFTTEYMKIPDGKTAEEYLNEIFKTYNSFTSSSGNLEYQVLRNDYLIAKDEWKSLIAKNIDNIYAGTKLGDIVTRVNDATTIEEIKDLLNSGDLKETIQKVNKNVNTEYSLNIPSETLKYTTSSADGYKLVNNGSSLTLTENEGNFGFTIDLTDKTKATINYKYEKYFESTEKSNTEERSVSDCKLEKKDGNYILTYYDIGTSDENGYEILYSNSGNDNQKCQFIIPEDYFNIVPKDWKVEESSQETVESYKAQALIELDRLAGYLYNDEVTKGELTGVSAAKDSLLYIAYQNYLKAAAELYDYYTGAKKDNKLNIENLSDEMLKTLSNLDDIEKVKEDSNMGELNKDLMNKLDLVNKANLLMDTYGEPKFAWIDKVDANEDGDAKAQWYENLYKRMQKGYQTLTDGLASSSEWIQFAFESGIVTMEQVDEKQEWNSMIYTSCSDIFEQTDSVAIARAEAEYKAAMNKIENKDKRYDLELKNIDTEHNSLQTEYDSIKTAIEKNIERTFKIYS